MGKTKVVEFGVRGVGKAEVYWKGEKLEEVEEHLGMLVEKGGSWRKNKDKLCFGEVEDARHVLFRCPAYGRQRGEVTAVFHLKCSQLRIDFFFKFSQKIY